MVIVGFDGFETGHGMCTRTYKMMRDVDEMRSDRMFEYFVPNTPLHRA